jgi:hypothetical protein
MSAQGARRRALAVTAVALTALGGILSAAPAHAAATTGRQPIDFPAAGATITCGSTVLTATAGEIVGQFHETQDGAGLFSFEGTNVARGVTATDDAGAIYRIVGTSGFSGTSTDPGGLDTVRWHGTVDLVVLGPDGGRFGRVGLVERSNAAGDVLVDLGTCTGAGGGED